MNKKLKFIVAGVAIVAGLASAVSCQDLSKDVEDLGKRVSTLENTVKDLQTKIDAGAVITSVTSTATGVKVTLSNGNSFDITNGKDGANGTNGTNGKDGKDGKDGVDGTPGSVVTIGENGNWFIDGVDTGLAAQGTKGEKVIPASLVLPASLAPPVQTALLATTMSPIRRLATSTCILGMKKPVIM